MTELNDDGRRLLDWLVSQLDNVEPGNPLTYFTYSHVHDEMGLRVIGKNAGRSLQGQGLNSLANWTHSTAKPAITGLVIRRQELDPGPGYFRLYGKGEMDYEWWKEQIQAAKEYDWSPYLEHSPEPPPLSPEASDLKPPERAEVMTYRVLRDSEVARKVKACHGYECQFCGQVIRLPDGRLYAEAHHIQPLGGDHGGFDVEENVLCVCPNHHAELDLGIWDIDESSLRRAPGHTVGAQYIRYHNDAIRKQWK